MSKKYDKLLKKLGYVIGRKEADLDSVKNKLKEAEKHMKKENK